MDLSKDGTIISTLHRLFWNGLNQKTHNFVVVDLISKVGEFAKAGHVHVMSQFAKQIYNLGLSDAKSPVSAKNTTKKRSSLGLLPIGLSALFILLFVGIFLIIASQ